LGRKVEFAKDGAEAVACYAAALNSEDPFDAVGLDLTVGGGMGGKEAIQKLKAIDPNVIRENRPLR
jgi:two-component system cell cycle sensor histidine kinase/response regulator CckA